MIQVRALNEDEYEVEVSGPPRTLHRVTVQEEDRAFASVPDEELVTESFRFLLERESNTSILSSFGLSVISRYFPEYRSEMIRRLGRRNLED